MVEHHLHHQFHGAGRLGHVTLPHAQRDMTQRLVKRQITIPGLTDTDDEDDDSGSGNSQDAGTGTNNSPSESDTTRATSTSQESPDTTVEDATSQIPDTTSSTAEPVTSSSETSSSSTEEETSSSEPTSTSSSSTQQESSTESETTSSSSEDASSSAEESSSSSPSSSSSSSSSSPSSSLASSSSDSSSEASGSTNIHYITGSSSASASASADSSSSEDDSPSTGAVIGIVAGSLVGVVVLAGILGYFFKAKCSKDDDEDELADAAFNKDDFRRESRMLGMDDDAMSMHSASQAGSLSRAGTYLPGLGRQDTLNPRPPSMFERQMYSRSGTPQPGNFGPLPHMPGYEPGHMVDTPGWQPSPYAQPTPTSDAGFASGGAYGPALTPFYGHGSAAGSVGLERGDTIASHYPEYTNLERNGSLASSAGGTGMSGGYMAPPSQMPHHMQGLSDIAEQPADGYNGNSLERTGTLEDPNPQQNYFSESGHNNHAGPGALRNPYE